MTTSAHRSYVRAASKARRNPCLFRTYEAIENGGIRQKEKEFYHEWK